MSEPTETISPPPDPPPSRATATARRWPRALTRICRTAARILAWVTLTLMTLWATTAVYFADLPSPHPRTVRAALFALAAIAAVVFLRPRRRYAIPALLLMFAAVLAWFLTLQPSNHRQWAIEVSRLPTIERHGSRVVIHNVRNFDYRSETDFTPAWEDRTYDLDQLQSADLVLSYWGSPMIAHLIASFGFSDGRYLAISIETRKKPWQTYSVIQGLFREYELIYVFADERDVLRVRTNDRHEDVYLYHTRLTPAEARRGFESYLGTATALEQRPEWYNQLTTNCATGVLPHARASGAPGRWSLDILFSGYAARQAYRNGNLATSLPYEELQRRSLINAAAQAADKDPDFSRKIRIGLPDARPPAP